MNAIRLAHRYSERVLSHTSQALRRRIDRLNLIPYTVLTHTDSSLSRDYSIFTVILVVYDCNLGYVYQAIDSILTQTYTNTELIIVDNGTSEKVSELIHQTFTDNPNVTLIKVPFHIYNPDSDDFDDPISCLWNAALFASVGDYVYFISCDDYLSSNYVSSMVKLYQNNSACTSACPLVQSVDENGVLNKSTSRSYFLRNQRKRYTHGLDLLRSYSNSGTQISFPGGIFSHKTSVVLDAGGFDSANDLTQLVKLAIFGISGFDPTACLYWRHHPNQANKKQASYGLIYYRMYHSVVTAYDLERRICAIYGVEIWRQTFSFIDSVVSQNMLTSIRHSTIRSGIPTGLRAVKRSFSECPRALYLSSVQVFASTAFRRIFTYNPMSLAMKHLLTRFFSSFKHRFLYRLLSSKRFLSLYVQLIQSYRQHLPSSLERPALDVTYITYEHSLQPPNSNLFSLMNNIVLKMADNNDSVILQYKNDVSLYPLLDYRNHYLFLTAFAQVISASSIVEIGTASGASLCSWLAACSVKNISTWDVTPIDSADSWHVNTSVKMHVQTILKREYPRWKQYVEDLSDEKTFLRRQHLFETADIIFLDGPHDGIFERRILDFLSRMRLQRDIYVILDDIHVSTMISLWSDIPHPKLDVSCIAHASGTGVFLLSPK